jgi:hypothetical protein
MTRQQTITYWSESGSQPKRIAAMLAWELTDTRQLHHRKNLLAEGHSAGPATFQSGERNTVTVMHLTNPEVRAANTELANAYGNGWTVSNVPDDASSTRGNP